MRRSTATPEHMVRSFVALYLEVEAGVRPVRHIRPLLSPDLQPVVGNGGRRGRMPDVLTVRLQCRAGVCEAVVLLGEQDRVSALALSVRRGEEGWRIAEISRPDDPQRRAVPVLPAHPLVQTTWHERTRTDRSAWALPRGWDRPDVAHAA